jgi:hypothetical protein
MMKDVEETVVACFNELLQNFEEGELSVRSAIYRPRFLLIASILQTLSHVLQLY